MHKEELIKYIHHPGNLDRETLDKVMLIKEQYPYFQSIRLLVVKNLYLLGEANYQTEIEHTAVYVADRRVLYELIYPLVANQVELPVIEPVETPVNESDQTEIPEKPVSKQEKTSLRNNISNLLSWQLDELELINPDEAELIPEIGIDIEQTYGTNSDLLTLDTESSEDEKATDTTGDSSTGWLSKIEEKHNNKTDNAAESKIIPESKVNNNLIDKFIVENPRLVPTEDNHPQNDISEDSVKEHDGIFTDTLAKIYVKQGYYSKAIFAYEKLILKYPEKSSYFAAQIEEIKKLINKQ
jgi:hypothetical protein